MQYASEAIVFPGGVRTRTAILDILGRRQTSVWGIWSAEHESPGGGDSQVLEQILLSMVHPSHAHACFRLTIRLQNRIGALAAAAGVLAALRVNVVSSSCAISGHRHSTWSVLCENSELADEPPPNDSNFVATCLAQAYLSALAAEDVLRFVDYECRTTIGESGRCSPETVDLAVEKYCARNAADPAPWRCPAPWLVNPARADADPPGGFLDLRWDRSTRGGHATSGGKLYFDEDATAAFALAIRDCRRVLGVTPYPDMSATANAWRFGLRRHAVEIASAPHLIAFAEECGRCAEAAFQLHVDDRESLLRVAESHEQKFAVGYERALRARPARRTRSLNSTFSFDAREGAGTVSVLQATQQVSVEFSYTADGESHGLLAAVLRPLTEHGLNLTNVTTALWESTPGSRGLHERGVAEIVGDPASAPPRVPDAQSEGWEELKRNLESEIATAIALKHAHGKGLCVKDHHNLTIFVSTRFDPGWVYGHGFNMIEKIAGVVGAMGFTPVFSLPRQDPIPSAWTLKEHLFMRVDEADSLLQILPILDNEPTLAKATGRLGWMRNEVHAAIRAKKPVVQVFQVIPSRAPEPQWVTAFDSLETRDVPRVGFATVTELLEGRLQDAVLMIAKELDR